jgi:hypothetical protein
MKNVTLFTYTGTTEGLDKAIKSLVYSASQLDFGSVKVLAPVESIDEDIELITVPPADHIGYSRFFVEDLHEYIDTDYCLNVQWDSSIINPHLWLDEFLDYDYIGSPWPNPEQLNQVGNGGFSLRSRKFLEASSKLEYDPYHPHPLYRCAPEDWFLCVKNYHYMIDNGIKFPTADFAGSFSLEHPTSHHHFFRGIVESYRSFGFHGDFNTGGMKKICKP